MEMVPFLLQAKACKATSKKQMTCHTWPIQSLALVIKDMTIFARLPFDLMIYLRIQAQKRSRMDLSSQVLGSTTLTFTIGLKLSDQHSVSILKWMLRSLLNMSSRILQPRISISSLQVMKFKLKTRNHLDVLQFKPSLPRLRE